VVTEESFSRMYGRALELVDAGAAVVLLPGELDGDYVIATWAWRVKPQNREVAYSRNPYMRVAYMAKASMKVREHLEANHGLVLA
jgi:hypothetical protein